MSRDTEILTALNQYRRRFLLADLGALIIISAAAAGVAFTGLWVAGLLPATSRIVAVSTFLLCATALARRSWRRWTSEHVAAIVEQRCGNLDNLVVTAEEVASRSHAWHPVIQAQVSEAALARLERARPADVQPVGQPLALAAGCAAALVALLVVGFPPARNSATAVWDSPDDVAPNGLLTAGDLRVIVTPPEYSRRQTTTLLNPESVAVLEGSRVRLEASSQGPAELLNLSGGAQPFSWISEGQVLDFTAVESRPLLIRFDSPSGASADRLVHLRVQPDDRPVVHIQQPAKDLIVSDPRAKVPVEIAARDDLGLASLTLRYTKVSGSGETFKFEEGEWPVRIERATTVDWTASGELSLDALNLQDGDTLVYRAVARDGRPGADPVISASYLIEIGRVSGVASMGFALPEERDRQAISQQMLIIKTERLHADKAKLPPDAFVEQSRLLAIEQRMVKAEFEFMTGGVVEDEVEEAAHSHELAEGRFENTGQAELITAIREMSRAEASLNTADTTQALEYERAALRALQRAFDRRRYLLRTLPERARIDLTRRLTGELETAQSAIQSVETARADRFLDSARELLRDLQDSTSSADAPSLASRILTLDPTSEEVQTVALKLAAARDPAGLTTAVRDAQRLVAGLLHARLAKAAPTPISRDPLAGQLVQELPPSGPPR